MHAKISVSLYIYVHSTIFYMLSTRCIPCTVMATGVPSMHMHAAHVLASSTMSTGIVWYRHGCSMGIGIYRHSMGKERNVIVTSTTATAPVMPLRTQSCNKKLFSIKQSLNKPTRAHQEATLLSKVVLQNANLKEYLQWSYVYSKYSWLTAPASDLHISCSSFQKGRVASQVDSYKCIPMLIAESTTSISDASEISGDPKRTVETPTTGFMG